MERLCKQLCLFGFSLDQVLESKSDGSEKKESCALIEVV